jgi:hypothetical protein
MDQYRGLTKVLVLLKLEKARRELHSLLDLRPARQDSVYEEVNIHFKQRKRLNISGIFDVSENRFPVSDFFVV